MATRSCSGAAAKKPRRAATRQVPFEVVPGVTSAIAAPAYAGIPVTHRGLSTSFTVVTGHEDPTKPGLDTDWAALARAGGTLVVLMGAGHIADIADALLAGGRPGSTPVAAVRWGTRPEQRTVRGTLATIAELGVESPSAIVIGEVAGLDLGWFESRPLFGRRVVVTRAREQASELRSRLEQLGAEVVELPSIALEPVDFELPALRRYEWIVFTSANGVDAFFDRGLVPAGLDARALARRRASRASGPEPAMRSLGVAFAPISFPNGSLPSRCSTRFPTAPRPSRGCCSPERSPPVTCSPTVSPAAATWSTFSRSTEPFRWPPMPPTWRACGPVKSMPSRSRRRRRSRTFVTRSGHSTTLRSWCRSDRSRRSRRERAG